MGLFSRKKDADAKADNGALLTVSVSNDGTAYTFDVAGRLDTNTSPERDAKLGEVLGEATKLTFEFGKLEYISSAGLRVLLGAAQAMEDKSKVSVCNANESVKEVFELTGFNRLFEMQ